MFSNVIRILSVCSVTDLRMENAECRHIIWQMPCSQVAARTQLFRSDAVRIGSQPRGRAKRSSVFHSPVSSFFEPRIKKRKHLVRISSASHLLLFIPFGPVLQISALTGRRSALFSSPCSRRVDGRKRWALERPGGVNVPMPQSQQSLAKYNLTNTDMVHGLFHHNQYTYIRCMEAS